MQWRTGSRKSLGLGISIILLGLLCWGAFSAVFHLHRKPTSKKELNIDSDNQHPEHSSKSTAQWNPPIFDL